MDWFRMYSEARNDAKLRKLTDAQFRIWFNLLCYASESEHRGVILEPDRELLALEVSDDNIELLESTLSRLSRLKIVTVTEEEIAFVHWPERQKPRYESDSSEATAERQRKHREKQRQNRQNEIETSPPTSEAEDVSRDVTSSHEDSHECHARAKRAEQSRKEQIRKEQSRAEQMVTSADGAPAETAPPRPPFVASDFPPSAPPEHPPVVRNGTLPPPLSLVEECAGVLTAADIADLLNSGPRDGPRWTEAEIREGVRILRTRSIEGKMSPRNAKAYLHSSILPEVRAGKRAPPPQSVAPSSPAETDEALRARVEANLARLNAKHNRGGEGYATGTNSA